MRPEPANDARPDSRRRASRIDGCACPGDLEVGILGEPARRRWFWRPLGIAAARGVPAVARAIEFSVVGEHFIRYSAEDVLPRLERRLREIRTETAGGVLPGMVARPAL